MISQSAVASPLRGFKSQGATLVALLLCVACASQPSRPHATAADSQETRPTTTPPTPVAPAATLQIKLYFGDAAVIAVRDCRATKPVSRTIAVTPTVADAALRLLFQGVTADEKKAGLSSLFDGLTDAASNPVGPLSSYYQGVSISNGVATVKFSGPALTYLNNTACIQGAVKGPIEDTLLQFPTVKSVQYAIDGQIFDQWDA